MTELGDAELVPETPFMGKRDTEDGEIEWGIVWVPDGQGLVGESYVNLIPTAQGGTHVNGFSHRPSRRGA